MATLAQRDSPVNTLRESYKSIRALVVDRLRDMVIRGELLPGDRLDQKSLAQAWGVSRTPLREAIHQLEGEGLLLVTPHLGVQVAPLDVSMTSDLYEIRALLEPEAAARGAEALTPDALSEMRRHLADMRTSVERGDQNAYSVADHALHRTLYARAGNRRMVQMIEDLQTRCERYRQIYAGDPSLILHGLATHEAILDACERGDFAKVRKLMRELLSKARAELLDGLVAHS